MDALSLVGTILNGLARATKRSRRPLREEHAVTVSYNGKSLGDRQACLAKARKLFDEGTDVNGERLMGVLTELFIPMAEFSWWTNEVTCRFTEPIFDWLNRFALKAFAKATSAARLLDWLFWRIARHVRVWTHGDNQGSMLRMFLPASLVALQIATWLDHSEWYCIVFSLPFLLLEALPMAAGSFVALAMFAAYCPRQVVYAALFPTWWIAQRSNIPDVPTLKQICMWWQHAAVIRDGREEWVRVRVFSRKDGEVGIISLLFNKPKKKEKAEASLAPFILA